MAGWRRLDFDDLKAVLAKDELDKLEHYSVDEDVVSICTTILDNVVDMFRGAFKSKGWNVDVREHYIAPSYANVVLNYARWQIWTRFPMSDDYALSEPRKALYEEARDMLKALTIGVENPDYSDDPELSGRTDLSGYNDFALGMPGQRILPTPYFSGFISPYIKNKTFGW